MRLSCRQPRAHGGLSFVCMSASPFFFFCGSCVLLILNPNAACLATILWNQHKEQEEVSQSPITPPSVPNPGLAPPKPTPPPSAPSTPSSLDAPPPPLFFHVPKATPTYHNPLPPRGSLQDCLTISIPPSNPEAYAQRQPHPPNPRCVAPTAQRLGSWLGSSMARGLIIFVEATFVRRSMYTFALMKPDRFPVLLWQQELLVIHSHFLPKDVKYAVAILDIVHSLPTCRQEHKHHAVLTARQPLPTLAEGQPTPSNRHHRLSLLTQFAPRRKSAGFILPPHCPLSSSLQFGSLVPPAMLRCTSLPGLP